MEANAERRAFTIGPFGVRYRVTRPTTPWKEVLAIAGRLPGSTPQGYLGVAIYLLLEASEELLIFVLFVKLLESAVLLWRQRCLNK